MFISVTDVCVLKFSERMSEAIVPESSGLRSCNELCPSALPSSPPLATEDECHHDNRKVEQQVRLATEWGVVIIDPIGDMTGGP